MRMLARLLVRMPLLAIVIGGAGVLLAASIAPAANVAANVVAAIDEDVLDFPPLPRSFDPAAERSVILARDGTVLAYLRDENRDVVPLSQVPLHVQNAVIATEDDQFRAHDGVNWRAIARAAVRNARAGEIQSGASTITQQLVKNLTEDDERSVDRKLREAAYAVELERRMSKDEILEEYLNRAYFGNRVYGIAAAAEYYFGKDVADLDVAEGALLAGMIRSPVRNDPIDHPRAALARRNIVLRQMAVNGYLATDEARRLQDLPLALEVRPPDLNGDPFFVTYVRGLLEQEPALGATPAERRHRVNTGGLEIRTTLEPRLRHVAEQAIREVLVDVDGPQGAVTAVDPRTGEILAIGVGPKAFGDGPDQSQVTPAVPGLGSPYGRQPGSAFKAFAVVAALEKGISPAYTMDTPSPYVPVHHCKDQPWQQQPWRPGNYSDGGGGVLDMAQATAKSSNVYFAALVDQFVGPEALVETARRMGVRSAALQANCAAVLGTEDVYGLDMASAFGTLANEGVHCRPYAITAVVDRAGRTVVGGDADCRRVVDRGVATRATALLRGAIEGGTATANGQIGRPAAGKTGTTQEYKNAWFVGYVPQLSVATWVGYERPREMTDPRCRGGHVTGGCLPTMVWQRFLTRAVEVLALPVEDFPPPPPLPRGPVPDVVGRTLAEAEALLREAQFTAVVEHVASSRPEGEVVEQTPAGGTEAELGSAVVVSVSDGTGTEAATLPLLVGLWADDALARLDRLGLAADVRDVLVDDPRDVGRVVAQRPGAGVPLGAVDRVTLRVGSGLGPGQGRTAATAQPAPPPRPRRRPAPAPAPQPAPQPSPTAATASPMPSGDETVAPDDETPSPEPSPTRRRRRP